MALFVLHHHHQSHECASAFAAWKASRSPLHDRPATSSCVYGGHDMWWRVEAADADEALALLPEWVAARTAVHAVTEIDVR
jgi:hypothetical protein